MRWAAAALALVLLAAAAPAVGSFHETIGIVPDRIHPLAMQGTSFNGLHAPQAPLLEAFLGERVRFAIVATETHTFHLHGHPWPVDGIMVDTFLVDHDTPHVFDVTAGSVDAHAGDWMYHCHFDAHMEDGMWGIFRVYPFATHVAAADGALLVTLDRLGEPLEGAELSLAIDGAPVPAHIAPQGGGRYLLHAALPAGGALAITATHAEHGESIGRLALGGVALPALTIVGHH